MLKDEDKKIKGNGGDGEEPTIPGLFQRKNSGPLNETSKCQIKKIQQASLPDDVVVQDVYMAPGRVCPSI